MDTSDLLCDFDVDESIDVEQTNKRRKKSPGERGWRYARQTYFLVYSHLNVPLDADGRPTAFRARFEALVASFDGPPQMKEHLFWCELRPDGSSRYHVYVKFVQVINLKDYRKFDLPGFGTALNQLGHPEIQEFSAKDAKNWLVYLRKQQGWLETDMLPNDVGNEVSVWARMRDNCRTRDEAMALLLKENPREYYKYGNGISHQLDIEKGTSQRVYQSPFKADDFNITPKMQRWVDEELPRRHRAYCLIIVGPSRIGKTCWARSLGHHMYFRNKFNVKNWDDKADYMVLDDVPWKSICPEADDPRSVLGCQGEVHLDAKYMNARPYMINKPAIYLTNKREPDFGDDWWGDNAVIIYMRETDTLIKNDPQTARRSARDFTA
jgi:hypothetical protein